MKVDKLVLMNYKLADESRMLTPNILLYPELVRENIKMTLTNCCAHNLRPHIKTIKCKELVQMLMEEGVTKFKCATLKEASLLAEVGAVDVLLAYPLVGANIPAFLDLIVAYPQTVFQVLVDSFEGAQMLNKQAMERGIHVDVFVDLNLGMNRTGVILTEAFELGIQVSQLEALQVVGLHGYDGHIHENDLNERIKIVNPVLEQVLLLYKKLEETFHKKMKLVLGGSNTFPIYRQLPFVECSPGTFMLWDWGYTTTLKEQPYHCAAILVSRVISKPTSSTLCLDLGHKSVAAENTIDKRIQVIGHGEWKALSQSEEHLIVEVPAVDWTEAEIGDLYYIIPYHICPTVAKYPAFQVVEVQVVKESWSILQRY